MELLRGQFEKGTSYYIVQRPDDGDFHLRFHRFKPELVEWLVINWDEGRIFSDELEIRWRKKDEDAYDVLALAEKDIQLTGFEPIGGEWQVEEYPVEKTGIYLWGKGKGKSQPEFWVETRIPRRLYYPSDRPVVRLGARCYRTEEGTTQLIRLMEVQ
jgi:hypothetical protein